MYDDRLLTDTGDEHVHVDLDPADAVRLVRRLRRVVLFVRLNMELVTERGPDDRYRCYSMHDSMRVPAARLLDLLCGYAEFNERKVAKGERAGRVPVTRLGNCLFVG